MDYNISIHDKITYSNNAEVQAQGCKDDCKIVSYTNTKPTNSVPVVGGPAVSAPVCTSKKKTTYTAETCPFW